MTCDEILSELRSLKDPAAIEGMARYGITSKSALGAPVPKLRALAKKAGRSHALSEELWETGIYEARVVATLVDNPAEVTEAQMERWVGDLDSWAICDGCCNNLFRKTSFAHAKAVEWSSHPQEYVKRAAFALMASLAVHDKEAADEVFLSYHPLSPEKPWMSATSSRRRSIGCSGRSANATAFSIGPRSEPRANFLTPRRRVLQRGWPETRSANRRATRFNDD